MPLQGQGPSTGEILAAMEAEPVAEAEEHVSQWDWQDCARGTPRNTDLLVFQPKATDDLSIPGFQDASKDQEGRSIMPQLRDHACNATRDNCISLDIMSGNLPSDAPQDFWTTSGSPRSQRLVSENDAWLDDHPVCVEDILQQHYGFVFD